MKHAGHALGSLALAVLVAGAASAQTPERRAVPQANIDAPSALGIMVGSPPAPDNQVTPANALRPRFLRWGMLNTAALFPTTPVSRGEAPTIPLERGPALDVEALRVASGDATLSMADFYRASGLDALVVMHRGKVVFERYLGDTKPTSQHALNSCTKSMVGTLVGMAANEGVVDLQAPASQYVPELAKSALGGATVAQLLDMRANFSFSDKPHQIGALQMELHQALGTAPRPKDYAGPDGIYELLLTARPTTPHGEGPMRYDNGTTEALGWILHRVTGKPVSQLISERFWVPLGAEWDGNFMLDPKRTPIAAFGLQSTARDLARFGEMMRLGGKFNGRQIVPAGVIESITKGGDRAAFAASPSGPGMPGGSYRAQWWMAHDELDAYACRGQFGQVLWIAPKAEVVIVQFSSDPDASNSRLPLRLAAYKTIARAAAASR